MIYPLEPNPAHFALVEIEKRAREFILVTQNIDGLHKKAGSIEIVELHGNVWRMRCTAGCSIIENHSEHLEEIPPYCHCGKILRPDVVWFGESLPHEALEKAIVSVNTCDVAISIGTSAVVYPAAALPMIARQNGAYTIEINLEPTPISSHVNDSILGKAGEILPEFVKAVWEN